MVQPRIDIPPDRLAALCRRHRIQRLSLFGSVMRDDFGPSSDVDMLVEFEAGHSPGWEIVDIEQEFSALFGGRKVDMVNPKYLNRHLKDRVLGEAVLQYETADE
jgi:predicted nucleotidyltransferase